MIYTDILRKRGILLKYTLNHVYHVLRNHNHIQQTVNSPPDGWAASSASIIIAWCGQSFEGRLEKGERVAR